jgi:hypothetical protein
MKFPVQIKPVLCVFGKLVYSHECALFQCITSKHMSSEEHVCNGAWPVWAGVAAVSACMQPLEPGKMLVGEPVASWLQRDSANSSAIIHRLFPFIHLSQHTKLYENENSCTKRTAQAVFSRRHCTCKAMVLPKAIFAPQANFVCATALITTSK